jgi:GTP-binding protein
MASPETTKVQSEFLLSAAKPEQFPVETVPEVAFLGRSNVGKSSLLNCLVGKRGLAFTSAKPGCTQVVNFYGIDGQFRFVDLPGYGYAKVPLAIREQWKGLIDYYLVQRESLRLSFLVLDSRRGWMDKDLELKQWLEFHNRRYLVIATKTDKLKTQKDRHRSLAGIREQLTEQEPLLFSAETGQGAREIWQAIWKIKEQA